MSKQPTTFHVNKYDMPAPCYAKSPEKCPLRKDAPVPHFGSKKEADVYIEKKLSEEKGVLGSKAKTPSPMAMPKKRNIVSTDNKKTPQSIQSQSQPRRYNPNSSRNNRHRPSRGYNNRNGEKKYFAVVGKLDKLVELDKKNATFHISEHRKERMKSIEEKCGRGEILAQFVVDKKHPNGNEIHQVKSNGCIDIYNENTGKHITTLIARPAQIERCYKGVGEKIPRDLLMKSMANTAKGFNNL